MWFGEKPLATYWPCSELSTLAASVYCKKGGFDAREVRVCTECTAFSIKLICEELMASFRCIQCTRSSQDKGLGDEKIDEDAGDVAQGGHEGIRRNCGIDADSSQDERQHGADNGAP